MISVRQALQVAGQLPKTKQYLRWDSRNLQPGDPVPPSRQWKDGIPTDKVLAGTCALNAHHNFNWRDLNAMYDGDLYLVTGRVTRRGYDFGEVILNDATVIKKLISQEVK